MCSGALCAERESECRPPLTSPVARRQNVELLRRTEARGRRLPSTGLDDLGLMVDGGLAGCDRRRCSRDSGSGRAAEWVSGRGQLAAESSLDAGVAAGSDMARKEPRRARSAVHGRKPFLLCFRAILLIDVGVL